MEEIKEKIKDASYFKIYDSSLKRFLAYFKDVQNQFAYTPLLCFEIGSSYENGFKESKLKEDDVKDARNILKELGYYTTVDTCRYAGEYPHYQRIEGLYVACNQENLYSDRNASGPK
ncbi:Hypothetical protein HVR_LOCUS1005 [uncultured virus]|nr:Hypothetical protein HVR_LOCUS1005 [uncultured virus]